MRISERSVLVLAEGDSSKGSDNAKGHLFEQFIARLLFQLGYENPNISSLNVTADGIEIDISVNHRLSKRLGLAECKAYTAPVRAKEVDAFYGKLVVARLQGRDADGFFFALPRLTQQGAEQARTIEKADAGFHYLDADAVFDHTRAAGLTVPPPRSLDDLITSDSAIFITEHGVYEAVKILDPDLRVAIELAVWAADGAVPTKVIELIQESAYGIGLSARDANHSTQPAHRATTTPTDVPVLVEVQGSRSDFEYQLPASPTFFVGRKQLIKDLEPVLSDAAGAFVVNAQSGWGKSSLALTLKRRVEDAGGVALVLDSRTANHPNYVVAAIRELAGRAERSGRLQLAAGAAWTSLASSLDTLKQAAWRPDPSPLMLFFDQFENVFANEALTREFRNLALSVRDLGQPLVVGFAWKTDLVSWTESHPYRLRDDIRAQSMVINLGPLDAREIDALLRRLDKSLEAKLVRDLRQRLREYSQGLPWLFKKLAGHILRELRAGQTQESLLSEGLNVQALFEADLAELQPSELEGIKYIARFAPIPASEVMEKVSPPAVQSLLDRRLIIQVGEKLDTYWDTFRDFLNTGRVPIEDSYILRQVPASVSRLLRQVVAVGGDASVANLARDMKTSENVIFNVARELRLFGVIAQEPNRVRLSSDIANASNREQEVRLRVASSLRRHRAYSTLTRLAEQHGGEVPIGSFARGLPGSFPAVEVAEKTWATYARIFAAWFDYAGLATWSKSTISTAPSRPGAGLFTASARQRTAGVFPQRSPGPSVDLLRRIGRDRIVNVHEGRAVTSASRDLLELGLVSVSESGDLTMADTESLNPDGTINGTRLRIAMERADGVRSALERLAADPTAGAAELGELLAVAQRAGWADSTRYTMGKNLRSWAKVAGMPVRRESKSRSDN